MNEGNTIHIELQIACEETENIPSLEEFEAWVKVALDVGQLQKAGTTELTIRIVDKAESEALNTEFRHQQKPTNVLSFPFEPLPGQEISYLGDLAICAPLMMEEAQAQGKSIQSHWAHLTVHGVLHLLGYDHQEDKEAEEMEALEVKILAGLGFGDPY